MKKLLLILTLFLFGCSTHYISTIPYYNDGKDAAGIEIDGKNKRDTKRKAKDLYLKLSEDVCYCYRHVIYVNDTVAVVTITDLDIHFLSIDEQNKVVFIMYDKDKYEKLKKEINNTKHKEKRL